MYGNIFGKIDELRYGLERMVATTGKVPTYNRFYLSGAVIHLNITIEKEMYVVTVDDEGYEVSKRNKKTSQSEKHRVEYDHIKDGSFLGLFKK